MSAAVGAVYDRPVPLGQTRLAGSPSPKNFGVVEYSLETVLEFDDLELAYDDAASRAGDIESYEEIFHDRDGIRIDARNPKSITEAYIAGRRLFIANTDWPVEADRRTFFESIQILAEADPSP